MAVKKIKQGGELEDDKRSLRRLFRRFRTRGKSLI
jgi:hypothetical protein